MLKTSEPVRGCIGVLIHAVVFLGKPVRPLAPLQEEACGSLPCPPGGARTLVVGPGPCTPGRPSCTLAHARRFGRKEKRGRPGLFQMNPTPSFYRRAPGVCFKGETSREAKAAWAGGSHASEGASGPNL